MADLETIVDVPAEELKPVSVFSASEIIKDVERKYDITSIDIDIDTQTCTVKRKSVLSWGDPLVAVCKSTAYDEVVLTGKEFYSVVGESYDSLSNLLYAYMTEKGI